ncbi:hypothetical protein JOB18_048938 [Solea senegalensis]|uniref:Uncharacterized protein n=1 Tax=Solea senegalensis TaxID=28829 RepID=A0AAV6SDU6_SOLSE|nr:hypothetical protein JOB18_048938 [Solea senegalensis]
MNPNPRRLQGVNISSYFPQSSLTAFPGEPTTSAPKANRITAAFHVSDLEKACIHAAAAAVTPQSDSNPAELRYTEGPPVIRGPMDLKMRVM